MTTEASGGKFNRVGTGASDARMCGVPCGLADGIDESCRNVTHFSQSGEGCVTEEAVSHAGKTRERGMERFGRARTSGES